MGKIRIKTEGDEAKSNKIKKLKKVNSFSGDKNEINQKVEASIDNEINIVASSSKTEIKDKNKISTYKEKLSKNQSLRSKKYQDIAGKVDRKKTYSLDEALVLLPELQITKFDESVELHINTTESGLSGNIQLPHGTGKKIRVAIADEKTIAEIENGKIDFDILLAEPEMMPKLAKIAKYLGPRGLMPNPKNGTVTQNIQESAKKYELGQVSYKTESKTPLLHLLVGKVSFGKEKLTENIKIAVQTVQPKYMQKIIIKSTMSQGIRIEISSI